MSTSQDGTGEVETVERKGGNLVHSDCPSQPSVEEPVRSVPLAVPTQWEPGGGYGGPTGWGGC